MGSASAFRRTWAICFDSCLAAPALRGVLYLLIQNSTGDVFHMPQENGRAIKHNCFGVRHRSVHGYI